LPPGHVLAAICSAFGADPPDVTARDLEMHSYAAHDLWVPAFYPMFKSRERLFVVHHKQLYPKSLEHRAERERRQMSPGI
jgi:hypothetical protein